MKAKPGLLAVGIFIGAMAAPGLAMAEQQPFVSAQVVGEHQQYRNLYRLRCASCHGENGEGTRNNWPSTGPALHDNPFIQHAPAAAIIAVIRKGRVGPERLYHDTYPNMPAFGVEMVPDVDALVQFLKTDLQR